MTVTCKKCNKTFKLQKYLDQHNRRKTPCTKVFQCSKCDKSFDSNSHLQQHLKRKTPCAPEEVPIIKEDNPDNKCQFCNRTYISKGNLTRHQKTCDKDTNMEVIMKLMIEKMDTIQEENREMKEMISKQLTTTGNPTVFNDNRQLNINFVNFPIQDLSQIDMKKVLQIVNNQPTNMIIPEIIEHIHGNPDYPEKQNVFMTKLGSDVTVVFGGTQEKTWHSIPKHEAINCLKTEAMGILTHRGKTMTNMRLLEAAQETNHKDMTYQDKITELAENDLTKDIELEKKLVGFGETFHSKRMVADI